MEYGNVVRLAGVGLLAFILSFITMIKSDLDLYMKPQLYALVLMNRIAHWVIFIFNSFYPFIFDRSWDGIFLGTLLITSVHWMWFKNECIVSYWEKLFFDPEYKMGQNPFHHPFAMDTGFHPQYGSQAMFDVIFTMSFVSVIIVLWRCELPLAVKINYIIVLLTIRYYIERVRKMKCTREN